MLVKAFHFITSAKAAIKAQGTQVTLNPITTRILRMSFSERTVRIRKTLPE
jgi:hypothetical protein